MKIGGYCLMSKTITGVVKKIVNSFDDGYCIFSVKIDESSKTIKACGTSYNIKKGVRVTLIGDFEFNDKYGEQFKCNTIEINKEDNDVIVAESFLSAGFIKGIGEAKARNLVKAYGTDLDSYFKDADKLLKINGITTKNVFQIMNSYRENKHLYDIYKLVNGDITANQAETIYKKYKEDAVNIILANPYVVIEDLDNFGFKKADLLAKKIGIKTDSPERIMAGIIYVLQSSVKEGSCFLYEQDVKDRTIDVLFPLTEIADIYYLDVLNVAIPDEKTQWDESSLKDLLNSHNKILKNIIDNWDVEEKRNNYIKKQKLDEVDIKTIDAFVFKQKNIKNIFNELLNTYCLDVSNMSIKKAYDNVLNNEYKTIVCDKNDKFRKRYYDRKTYLVETEIAQTMSLTNKKEPGIVISDEIIEKWINKYQEEKERDLNKEQREDVYKACKNKISISTGGPGRGKTTVIEIVANSWIDSGGEVLLLAPTGRAAQRMLESTGYPARTIHRELQEAQMCPYLKNYDETLLVIVDEASMMDLWLARKLFFEMKRCSFLFSGDKDQLPSVGVGNFFEDILKSEIIPTTYLLHCYRNAGSILQNSDIINSGGRVRDLKVDNHFKMYFSNDSVTVQKNIISLYKAALKKFDMKDVLILTPRKDTTKTSVKELNEIIQNLINPKKDNRHCYKEFRLNDRVIQLKNNYDIECKKNGYPTSGVFNGETGTIIDINPDKEIITVKFDDDKTAYYPFYGKAIASLSLGYAVTMHKSQGSEFPCVILTLMNGDYVLLSRKIIYTAESRAQQMAYFCGDASALQRAISNSVYQTRNTVLSERLNQWNDYYVCTQNIEGKSDNV